MGLLQDQPLRMLKEKHGLHALAQTETWFIPQIGLRQMTGISP